MSFNSCTINGLTINALCGSRRAAIIDSLRPRPVVSSNKAHPYHSRINYARDVEHIDPKTIESSIIGFQIELDGNVQMSTFEMKNDVIPMVSISKFTCETDLVESVNISNITVKVL